MPSTAKRPLPPLIYRVPAPFTSFSDHWVKVCGWTLILSACMAFWVMVVKAIIGWF